jgi:hypothetical protein
VSITLIELVDPKGAACLEQPADGDQAGQASCSVRASAETEDVDLVAIFVAIDQQS